MRDEKSVFIVTKIYFIR